MNRLGLMYRSELEGEAKDLYDDFYDYTTNKYGEIPGFVYLGSDGRFVGPFGAELHTPAVGQHFLGMAKSLAQIPGLSARHREIAIITTGVRFRAAYELQAHTTLAMTRGVLSTQECEDIVAHGKRPDTFDEQDSAVYHVAYELAHGTGPLSQSAWDKAVLFLDTDGVTALVQYVAFYSYICMILKGFDCKVPATAEEVAVTAAGAGDD